MHRFLSIGLTFSFVLAASAAGQSHSHRPTSFDVTIGPNHGWGGDYWDPVAVGAELTFVPGHTSAWITALTFGGATPMGHGDICVFNAAQAACLDRFPTTGHFGLLGGLERLMPGIVARGTLGPAFYFGEGRKGLGPMARVDLATAGFSHLGLVLVAQGELIIRSGETLRRGSLQFGLRLR